MPPAPHTRGQQRGRMREIEQVSDSDGCYCSSSFETMAKHRKLQSNTCKNTAGCVQCSVVCLELYALYAASGQHILENQHIRQDGTGEKCNISTSPRIPSSDSGLEEKTFNTEPHTPSRCDFHLSFHLDYISSEHTTPTPITLTDTSYNTAFRPQRNNRSIGYFVYVKYLGNSLFLCACICCCGTTFSQCLDCPFSPVLAALLELVVLLICGCCFRVHSCYQRDHHRQSS